MVLEMLDAVVTAVAGGEAGYHEDFGVGEVESEADGHECVGGDLVAVGFATGGVGDGGVFAAAYEEGAVAADGGGEVGYVADGPIDAGVFCVMLGVVHTKGYGV